MPHFFQALVIVFAALVVTGSSARALTPTPLAQIEQATQQIRELAPLHPVKAAFLPNKKFDAVIQANLRKGETDSDIEIARRELVLLGLLGPTVNYHRLIFDNITSQVLGLYDYDAKELYVRSDTGNVFGIDRYAIAHEYTHALQDQHYGLRKLMPDEDAIAYRNSDAESAHHALIEGDAVNTQLLYISRVYTPSEIRALVTAPQPAVKPLPAAIQREFDFPYTAGVQFVQKLYKSGGMAAVDQAYQRLPRSTFEIMHPSYYQQHWKPATVTLHGVDGFTDWKQVDDDVNGAFGIELVLWQHVGQSEANSVTDAYRGDRYIFLEQGTQSAMLLKMVWTSPATAKVAAGAWVQNLKVQMRNARVSTTGSTTTVNGAQSVYVHVSKNVLKVAYAPTAVLARQLGTAPTH